MEIRTILVPVDFSEHASKALGLAIQFARCFRARVELLHCYPPPAGAMAPYGMAFPMNLEEEMRRASVARVDEWVQKVAASGLEATGSVKPASPAQGILERAAEIDADLIVMGTRGISGLKHVVLGSVAERTLRTAPCPVLTVKDDEA